MKKKLFVTLSMIILIITGVFCLTGCNDDQLAKLENNISELNSKLLEYEDKIDELENKIKDLEQDSQENFQGLNFYLLPDGTYGVACGTTYYLEEISIPETYKGQTVTKIVESAFISAKNLKTINIPNTIETIDNNAFFNCKELTNITLPNSLTSLGTEVFNNCIGLQTIIIPDSVTKMGDNAFKDCTNLQTITLGKNLIAVGENAFLNCSSLNRINFTGTIDDWVKTDFANASANPFYYTNVFYINNEETTSLTLSTSTRIGNYALANCKLPIYLSSSYGVISIGNYSFYNASITSTISLTNSLKSIGEYAFYGCKDVYSTIYFSGTESEWNSVEKGNNWKASSSITQVYSYVDKKFIPV